MKRPASRSSRTSTSIRSPIGLGLTLACDQTQFDAEQRQWLGDYYEQALGALVADPSARYELVDLMTDRERAQLLRFQHVDRLAVADRTRGE